MQEEKSELNTKTQNYNNELVQAKAVNQALEENYNQQQNKHKIMKN